MVTRAEQEVYNGHSSARGAAPQLLLPVNREPSVDEACSITLDRHCLATRQRTGCP